LPYTPRLHLPLNAPTPSQETAAETNASPAHGNLQQGALDTVQAILVSSAALYGQESPHGLASAFACSVGADSQRPCKKQRTRSPPLPSQAPWPGAPDQGRVESDGDNGDDIDVANAADLNSNDSPEPIHLTAKSVIRSMRAALQREADLIAAERFREAEAPNNELKELKERLFALPVCHGCLMEEPSRFARTKKYGGLPWTREWCPFCIALHNTRRFALDDPGQQALAHNSLQHRVHHLMKEAEPLLPHDLPQTWQRAFSSSLRQVCFCPGQGKGLRRTGQLQSNQLIGEIHRTCARVEIQGDMQTALAALRLTLKLLCVA
jgi:hypothetical protein